MEEKAAYTEEIKISKELKRIFEGDDTEKNDLICWGYRAYWPGIKMKSGS